LQHPPRADSIDTMQAKHKRTAAIMIRVDAALKTKAHRALIGRTSFQRLLRPLVEAALAAALAEGIEQGGDDAVDQGAC